MRGRGLILLAAVLFVGAAARDGVDDWVASTVLPPVLSETSVEVRDRNGDLLRAYQVDSGLWRLAPDDVDPEFVEMLLRYEDKRFRSHPGVDPLAMLRATAQTIWNGRVVSGGSTLTMQVARLLEDGTTGRLHGKIRQIRVALALEQQLSKEQILRLYLTHAPYGGNLEGIRAASLAWFGKEPRRLTPAQSALLVALPQSPNARRPDRNPVIARAARDRVLQRLEQAGRISADNLSAALREPVPARLRAFPQLAAHAADRVRSENPEVLRHDLTLDAGLQARLQPVAARAASTAGSRVSTAILVADHRSGEILASIGSPGLHAQDRQGHVDMTRALRSPGSTLKPLVYGLAFDRGLAHPETLILDGPVDFDGYRPINFDRQYRGDVRLREALQMSLNIPVVKLLQEIGPPRLLAALQTGGAAPRLPGGRPGLAIALGGIGMSLRDLVQIYAGLAAGGQGAVLRDRSAGQKEMTGRVLSQTAAWQISDILSGLAPPVGGVTGRIAYKTGTSYGHRDAWAVGFDGAHVVGVWLGRPDGTPVPGAFGGDLAAPILFEVFGYVAPDPTPLPPPPPETLILGSAELPEPLQRFRPRSSAFADDVLAPDLIFPPDGALLRTGDGLLTLKLRGGTAPFTVLADGMPVASGIRQREFDIPAPGPGFASLVVLDSHGGSDRVKVRID
ncbi:penicillin-binding protein 1C [Primorskyibacter sp. S87]|uniref:penicillin-binding protein 1C n=1 Tax=Primorskyibacter sp. S87 TaxID=3415126 RepID=UPI003C7AD314